MRETIDLAGRWRLSWSEDGPEALIAGSGHGHLWLSAEAPAPIHEALMEAGIIEDPNIALNSLRCRWVEEQVWVYRREFSVPTDKLRGSQWLIFDWLEHSATVWLNGVEVGRHANSHRRAVMDVTGHVREGANALVVAVETGLHAANDQPVSGYGFDRYAMLTRRPLLRKAQYQCGWDWNPRLMNVGILGGVRLECSTEPVVDGTAVVATVDGALRTGHLTTRLFVRWPNGAQADACRLSVRVNDLPGATAEAVVTREPDDARVTVHEVSLTVENPALWWPVGHGEQALYDVDVTLETGGGRQHGRRRVGFRKVEIDQSPHPDAGRHFVVVVNGRRVFCKGGNWVPPDLLPSRVPAGRYEALVRLAVEANFNTLRVWGGGVFAPEPLLDACDRAGVLVWHDFLFACAKYPADDPAFVTEVEAEVTEAVRRMAHHPSLVVWCGNNEVEWGDREWGYRERRPVAPHHALFHHHLPAIVSAEDQSKVYWPSSPWSPDFAAPNDPTTGDQHPWGVSILDPGPADFHKYRTYVDRFPNEGGILGASLPATLRDFLPPDQQTILSPSWVHHDNPIAYRPGVPGGMGRAYATFSFWTGLDPLKLDMAEYALLSAVLQAEGLCEYIANYRRRMFSSASAIFWMYNDSWPVTHGWTIVDYYLRRRLCYHPVRRAFQPVTVVVADQGDSVGVFGVNDTPSDWLGSLRWGLFGLAGGYPVDRSDEVRIPSNASVRLAEIARSEWERADTRRTGAFALLTADGKVVAQHRLFVHRFRDLELVDQPITVTTENGQAALECAAFAWGVCLDAHGGRPGLDNCFDLLPGVRYTLPWSAGPDEPRVEYVGSSSLLRLTRKQAAKKV